MGQGVRGSVRHVTKPEPPRESAGPASHRAAPLLRPCRSLPLNRRRAGRGLPLRGTHVLRLSSTAQAGAGCYYSSAARRWKKAQSSCWPVNQSQPGSAQSERLCTQWSSLTAILRAPNRRLGLVSRLRLHCTARQTGVGQLVHAATAGTSPSAMHFASAHSQQSHARQGGARGPPGDVDQSVEPRIDLPGACQIDSGHGSLVAALEAEGS